MTDTIPLIAVAFAANLAAITQFVPFLDNWSNNSAITFAAVAGILPPVLSVLLQLLLPMIMRRIGKFQGARTKTKRCAATMAGKADVGSDRDVFARYWAFGFITQFIIFSLISVLYQFVTEVIVDVGENRGAAAILKSITSLPGQLQTAYVQQVRSCRRCARADAAGRLLDDLV